IWSNARARISTQEVLPAGRRFDLCQQLTRATIATHVVFPIYLYRQYVRHYSPGRNWDSLYTWDSGFIGLGLLEMDVRRAIECLNMYLTDPGDQSAFIHHGSPLPTQVVLYQEIWNRTHSRHHLAFFYPRLR